MNEDDRIERLQVAVTKLARDLTMLSQRLGLLEEVMIELLRLVPRPASKGSPEQRRAPSAGAAHLDVIAAIEQHVRATLDAGAQQPDAERDADLTLVRAAMLEALGRPPER